jgi:REP element-mobilizing transposase RayT
MNDPIAYFITWTTYGSWLPGDERGWIDRDRSGIQSPDAKLKEFAERAMTEEMVTLSDDERTVVESVIDEHCRVRGWILHARNARTNHVHVVVTALVTPEKVREQLKAWASRRLSERLGLVGSGKDGKTKWWTEKGDIELIWDEDGLARVIDYVLNRQ